MTTPTATILDGLTKREVIQDVNNSNVDSENNLRTATTTTTTATIKAIKNNDGDESRDSSAASAVDLEAIEQQKENIQPLTAGRSAKQLNSLFTSDKKALHDQLARGHERFKEEIRLVEEEGADDPLDVYHRYVRWTVASYPTGPSHASHLVPLLERATRRFVNEEQYRSDIRLLKLWILYSKYIDCPKDIFRFLEGRQLGVNFASFYEEWAILEEQSNNFAAADAVYNLGLARRAQPLDRLKKRREAFQARMLLPRAANTASASSPSDAPSGSSRQQPSVRPILGGRGGGGGESGGTGRSESASGQSSHAPSSSSSAAAATGTAAPHFRGTSISSKATKTALPNNGAAGFAVFKDGSALADNPPAQAQAQAPGGEANIHAQQGWTEFATTSTRRKENERTAVPWKGETLPMSGGGTAGVPSQRLEVFRDEDAPVPAVPLPNHEGSGGLSLSRSIRGPGEAELLRKDPFRYYSDPVHLVEEVPKVVPVPSSSSSDTRKASTSRSTGSSKSSSSSSSSSTTPSSSNSARPHPSNAAKSSGHLGRTSSSSSSSAVTNGKRPERVASPLHDIYPEGVHGPEYSFEEIRAHKLSLRDNQTSTHLSRTPGSQTEDPWQVEARETGCPWRYGHDGSIMLRDPQTGEALFEYLREQDRARRREEQERADKEEEEREERERQRLRREEEERARIVEEQERRRLEAEEEEEEQQQQQQEEARRRREEEESRRGAAEEAERMRLGHPPQDEQERARTRGEDAERRRLGEEGKEEEEEEEDIRRQFQGGDRDDDDDDAPSSDYRRPPSPTINTKAALAEVNAMFSKTMRFDGDDSSSDSDDDNDSDEDDDGFDDQATPILPPSQAETDDTFWSHSQSQHHPSQSASQPAIPLSSQTSSFGGSLTSSSESGETTEDSDNDNEARPVHDKYHHHHHLQPLSRSSSATSSSSDSAFGGHAQPSTHPTASELSSQHNTAPSRRPEQGIVYDENSAVSVPHPARLASASRPMRTPLGAKVGGLGLSSSSSSKPAFGIFQDSGAAPVPAAWPPTSQPRQQRIDVFTDDGAFDEARPTPHENEHDREIFEDQEEEEEEYPEDIHDPASETPGYSMGRRVAGNNRFASMMDVMTPITERTCELGMATMTMTQRLGEEGTLLPPSGDDEVLDVARRNSLANSRGPARLANTHRELSHIEEEGSLSQSQDRSTSSDDASGASTIVPSASPDEMVLGDNSNALSPCDPLASVHVDRILNQSSMPITRIPGFIDCRDRAGRKLEGLQRVAKQRRKSANNTSRSSAVHEDSAAWELSLNGTIYSVREKLGEGGYGAVFRIAEMLEGEDLDLQEEDDTIGQTALKVQKPANLWEFWAVNRLRSRLPKRALRSVIRPDKLYAYQDESHLLIEYCDQGTLLDAVNHAVDAGISPNTASGGLDELLAIFFTIELLRTIESFHEQGFIHGDFKIDNCLVRLEEVAGGAREWKNAYARDGSNGWGYKGLRLIDFGRTIDLHEFPQGQTFSTNWCTDKHDCPEIVEGEPWVYQPDYYGLACIVHVMLFGKYLETTSSVATADGLSPTGQSVRYRVKEPFKRYHQIELWQALFDILLNPGFYNGGRNVAVTRDLQRVRERFEDWLEVNADKHGKSLKGLLKKLEIHALSSRQQ